MMSLPIGSPAVAHGLGLFETLLAVDGRAQRVEEHLERMTQSARALQFPEPDAQQFREEIARVMKGDRAEHAVRCVYAARSQSEWVLEAEAFALPEATRLRRERGRALTLDASRTRSLPEHKLTSYAVCTIGLREAIAAGADEALFVDEQGGVLEGTSTNVFAVRGSTLVTAPTRVLPGIVRDFVLREASALGMRVEERAASREELRAGSFLTSSLTLFAPIRVLDGEPCEAPEEIVNVLRERWAGGGE
jgi:4-amino-4-deoxychorismate lyase